MPLKNLFTLTHTNSYSHLWPVIHVNYRQARFFLTYDGSLCISFPKKHQMRNPPKNTPLYLSKEQNQMHLHCFHQQKCISTISEMQRMSRLTFPFLKRQHLSLPFQCAEQRAMCLRTPYENLMHSDGSCVVGQVKLSLFL